jgi:catechol 2,3-dioxygenase-like lactoylglutathione lyase family enzyme/GNAT superfamily N-acetyltransferase
MMESTPVLREVTDDNLRGIVLLSDTLTASQRRCVAPNAVSVAQGLMSGAWYRAIYLGEDPIGFIMVAMHPPGIDVDDRPAAFLWRFMIAKPWQRRGYGAAVLDQVVELLRERGYATFYTSCVTAEGDGPLDFYLRYGFDDTGKQDEDGEQILRMALGTPPSSRKRFIPVAPRISLVTIWTDDMDPMKRFYCEVLGFPVKNDLGDYVEFESPGVRFAICRRTVMAEHSEEYSRAASGQAFELAFPCESPEQVDLAYAEITRNGAAAVAAPGDMPWGQRTALFADPDGNIHEIFADIPGTATS